VVTVLSNGDDHIGTDTNKFVLATKPYLTQPLSRPPTLVVRRGGSVILKVQPPEDSGGALPWDRFLSSFVFLQNQNNGLSTLECTLLAPISEQLCAVTGLRANTAYSFVVIQSPLCSVTPDGFANFLSGPLIVTTGPMSPPTDQGPPYLSPLNSQRQTGGCITLSLPWPGDAGGVPVTRFIVHMIGPTLPGYRMDGSGEVPSQHSAVYFVNPSHGILLKQSRSTVSNTSHSPLYSPRAARLPAPAILQVCLLVANTRYSFTLRSQNLMASSGVSIPLVVHTPPPTRPVAPTLRLMTGGATGGALALAFVTPDTGGVNMTSYELKRCVAKICTLEYEGAPPFHTVGGLQPTQVCFSCLKRVSHS
jgi:hypothetical protein